MRYIVSFGFTQVKGDGEYEGNFQVVLDAVDVEAVVSSARNYLIALQITPQPSPFDGHVDIYIESIIELTDSLSRPALVNFTSRRAEQVANASIQCSVVDSKDGICSYEWRSHEFDRDDDESYEFESFLVFDRDEPTPPEVPHTAGNLVETNELGELDQDELDELDQDDGDLFVVRWPNGRAALLRAASFEHVADQVDEIGDPGQCEVTRYRGPLSLRFELLEQHGGEHDGRYLAFSSEELESSLDCERALIRTAFPDLDRSMTTWDARRTDDGPEEIDTAEWKSAVANEMSRCLRPSEAWIAGISSWWEGTSGNLPNQTAALRQMVDVSIPGEPRPETPEQQALFEAEQIRIMQRMSAVFSLGGQDTTAPTQDHAREPADGSEIE